MNKYFGIQGRFFGILMLPLLSAYVSLTESSKSDFDGSEDRTTFACDGSPLLLSCSEGSVIQITRANYGRFSIAICNEEGRTDWSVNCFAPKSSSVLSESCNNFKTCQVNASDFDFGSDPCPGTRRYLEAHYNCVPASDQDVPPWLTSGQEKSSQNSQKASRRVPITAAPTTTSSTTPTTTSTTTSSTTSPSTSAPPLKSKSSSILPDSSTFRSVSAAPIFYVESSSTSGVGTESNCHKRLYRGLRWPETPSGTESSLLCPNDPLSMARWACESGTWVGDSPDLSECESPWLRKLVRRADGAVSVGELLGRIRSSALYGGDILGSLKILKGLIGKRMGSWRHKDLISALSTLLDSRAFPAWKDLNESLRERTLWELMDVTEDLAGGFRVKDLSLRSKNIDVVARGAIEEDESFSEAEGYLYFNSTRKEIGVSPPDLLKGKPERVLVFATFRRTSFLLEYLGSSAIKSVSLYEEGQRVNYEGGSTKASFEGQLHGECKTWHHMNWEGRPCVSRGSDCLCQTYGRIALFQAESPNLGDAPNIISEEEDGISEVTFIIVVVITSIISVATLLGFTLIIIYCRRVKIQDKWDRSWYCRKRETDLSDTNTASTIPQSATSGSSLLHHQMSLQCTEGYSHPLFGGGSTLNRHHLTRSPPRYTTTTTTAVPPTSNRKNSKAGYQELCINPQYGSQTLLGNSVGPSSVKADWASVRRSDFAGKRAHNSEELVFALPPTSTRGTRSSRSGYTIPSSTSSSSGGGHIYMEVDHHRVDGDSGFTEESEHSGRRIPHASSSRLLSEELLLCEDEGALSSPRDSRSSEDEQDFEPPMQPCRVPTRRVKQHRSNETYLLSWQVNNNGKKHRGTLDKVYKDEGTIDERDVFTITGFNGSH